MSLAYDAERNGLRTPSNAPPALPGARGFSARAGVAQGPNTIRASQARAARQRDARRDEQAVSAWLRELASRRSA